MSLICQRRSAPGGRVLRGPPTLGAMSVSHERAKLSAHRTQAGASQRASDGSGFSQTPYGHWPGARGTLQSPVYPSSPDGAIPHLLDGNVGIRQSNAGRTSPSPRHNAAIAFCRETDRAASCLRGSDSAVYRPKLGRYAAQRRLCRCLQFRLVCDKLLP